MEGKLYNILEYYTLNGQYISGKGTKRARSSYKNYFMHRNKKFLSQ